jgi:hypothetical protein
MDSERGPMKTKPDCCADDCRHAQVTQRRWRRADTDRLIGEFHILGFTVGFGMHDNGFDAHFAAGALDAQRYFTTIGNENFFKHKGECLTTL